MIVDGHAHLIGMHPKNGCFASTSMRRGPVAWLLKRSLGLGGVPFEELDAAYVAQLIRYAEDSELDAVGVLAFDGVYDARGKLDEARTSLMVSNDYCFEVCARSKTLWPIASINPQREGAMDELERVSELGAVAIKTLPNSQGFDPANPAYRDFWARMAELELPLLTHTSFEHTIPPLDQSFGHPEHLVPVLEEGTTVIAAHCAGSGTAHPFVEHYDVWRRMLERYERLYGDISAMATVSRYPYIHRVLSSDLATSRVLMGSDYPIPVQPSVFLPKLGVRRVRQLLKITNPLQRNYETFRALGVGEEVMGRAWEVMRMG